MDLFSKNSDVNDYAVFSRRLVIPFSIVHNATPANKVVSDDLNAAMYIATQGQTAAAAAVDSGTNFITPTDSTGNFGVLFASGDKVLKVLRVSVDMTSSGTATCTLEGASNTGVTASNNIAVSVTSNQNLSTTDLTGSFSIDYILAE